MQGTSLKLTHNKTWTMSYHQMKFHSYWINSSGMVPKQKSEPKNTFAIFER